MFGSLKKLFGREEKPTPPPASPIPQKETKPIAPTGAQAAGSPTPPPEPEVPEERIAFSFEKVAAKFPPNIAASVLSPAKEVAVPLKKVLALLPTGSVKIPFGDLRRNARPGTFSQDAINDDTLVEIPLPEVLAKLSPGQLARRPAKKTLDAPPEVTPLFGSRGEALPQPKAPATPKPVAPQPVVPLPAATPAPASATPIPTPAPAATTAPVPPSPSPAARIAAPHIPLPDAPKKPEPAKSPAPIPAPSIPLPPSAAKAPAPKPSGSPAPTAAAMPVAVPGAPILDPTSIPLNFVVVSVSEVSTAWPTPVKLEIEQDNLVQASIQLPLDKVEQALRVGKIIFPWSLVRSWMKPTPPAVPSPSAELLVELPLPLVAPRFMAQHRPIKAQKKIQVGDNIPNLFSGAPAAPPAAVLPAVAPAAQPTAPAPVIPTTPAPPPAAPIPTAPAATVPSQPPPPPTPRPVPTPLGLLFGQADKREWSPAEMVQKTCTLKGVAGAVISTTDGLSVAGQVGAPLSTDTVAAFLPQIFSRLSQSTHEMQLGELKRVSLELEKAQCQIFKCGRVYFAILGRAGETLPAAELKTVALALEKQNQ